MLKLHVVQAGAGDCLILQAGAGCFVLIDGGPKGNGAGHLAQAMRALEVRSLALIILSHVDNDHVLGLLEFLADVQKRRLAGVRWGIAALWLNAFNGTVGEPNLRRLKALADEDAVRGFEQGGDLAQIARELDLPINPGFAANLVAVEDQPKLPLCEDLDLRVVAPDVAGLERLKGKWEDWLAEAEKEAAVRGPRPSLDWSPTNRSSIVVFAKSGKRTALLTGDARWDDIKDGLKASGLSKDGRIHVNLLKVQHHGSRRNASAEFFHSVTADKYVVSGDGSNPHLECLEWLVDAARAQGRRIELYVTNFTEAVLKLMDTRPPKEFGYSLEVMKKGDHVRSIDV